MLEEAKINFTLSEHKAVMTCEEAAETRGASLASGAKAMLIKDCGKKLTIEGVPFYLAVLSASNRFSSKQFKKVISCKNFKFASPQEVFEKTGCLPGAVPPFGKLFGVPVWVDRSLKKQDTINFNCGLRTHSMSMTYADYFKAEEPKEHVFTDEEIELGDLPVEEKKEAPKDTREAKKAERLAARQNQAKKKGKEEAVGEAVKDENDTSAHLFGERDLNRSQGDPNIRFTKVFTRVQELDESMKDKEVIVRGRYHASRGKGGICFIVIRQTFSTV